MNQYFKLNVGTINLTTTALNYKPGRKNVNLIDNLCLITIGLLHKARVSWADRLVVTVWWVWSFDRDLIFFSQNTAMPERDFQLQFI